MMKCGIKNLLHTNANIQTLFQRMSWFSSVRSLWFFSLTFFNIYGHTEIQVYTRETLCSSSLCLHTDICPRAE